MNSLVSIIIPVYNVEDYLDRCVESIINQTYTNLEIILVDDGSSDSCPRKCDEWAEKDMRIKVIHKENGGLGFARNSGLDIATGEYIVFVDSDDYISLSAIENMVKRIKSDDTDLVVAQKVKIYSDGTQMNGNSCVEDEIISKAEAFHRLILTTKTFPSSACAKLYRKNIFEKVRFTSLKTAEDTFAIADIIDQSTTISISSEVVYFYFQRDNSIIHTMTYEKQLDNMKAMIHVARFLLNHDYIKEACHYYNAAVCCSIKMKNDKKAKQLLKDSFNPKERNLFKRVRDKKMLIDILVAKFPSAYRFYKLLMKKK